MKKLPWVQFWYRDWVMDTQTLSMEESGCWLAILCQMWMNGTGKISMGYDGFQALFKHPDWEKTKAVLQSIHRKGIAIVQMDNADVTVTSRRLHKEESERESNRIRVERHRSNADVMPSSRPGNGIDVDVDVKSDVEKDKKPPLPPKGGFENLWARYPRREGKKAAERHYQASVRTMQDFLDCQNSLDNYLKQLRINRTELQYTKQGSTWFNNWRDYVNYAANLAAPATPPPAAKPVLRVHEPPAPELSRQDRKDMHDAKVEKLGPCRMKGCEFCVENAEGAKVIAAAIETLGKAKAMP